jgi:cytochrome bd-type quinol oxidase subunit 2
LAERRWDIFHTLSSTIYSLCLGLGIGAAFRYGYYLSLGGSLLPNFPTNWAETVILTTILAIGVLLIFFLHQGSQWILTISAVLHEARIRNSKVAQYDLKDVFPSLFSE